MLVGGKVSDHKGINLPGVAVSVPALSEKDIEDLRFALHLTVDFIALSFVRSAADVEDVRRVMREENVILPVIAKIEKPQAIENLDEVIAAFDGFMVARGDLGVEMPAEEVPFLQKKIIDKARLNAKPVIVATQMLESMISSPTPTRAEVSDVANAILDGADAVMLSGETGVGEYPVHTVETMARIIQATEEHAMEQQEVGTLRALPWDPHTKSGVIAKAAGEVAERIEAKYVVAFTQSGDSARRMSRLRGPVPVLAFTPEAQTRSQLSLTWGVETFKTADRSSTPTRWSPRSTSSCSTSAGSRRATSSSSSPARRRASRAPPTRCACTAWATRSTASRRRTGGPSDSRRSSRAEQRCVAAPTVECPGWDSNPHWMRFELIVSAGWTTGASGRQRLPEQRRRAPLGKSRVIHYSFVRDLGEQRLAVGGGEQRAGGGERAGGRHRVFPARVERAEVEQFLARLVRGPTIEISRRGWPPTGR